MSVVGISTTTSNEMSAPAPQAGAPVYSSPIATPVSQPEANAKAQNIAVTEKALKRIRSAMAKEGVNGEQGGLRVGITGGGCSGLSYNIRFDSQPRERDRVYVYQQEGDKVQIFVDPKSVPVPQRHDARLRRNAHAPGLQLHQPTQHQELRLRLVLHGLRRTLPTELQASEHRRRWEFLDAVRGLAVALIVVQHSPTRLAKAHLSMGLAGVVAFCLVSGFILPTSLERYGSLPRFWMGRVLRIVPLYYFCAMAVTYETVRRYGVLFTSHIHWSRYFVGNALLLQQVLHVPFAIDVSWTLTYEVAFCLVCSLLFAAGVQARSTVWLWTGMALSVAASVGYHAVSHHVFAATALGLVVTAQYGAVVFRYFEGTVSRAAVLWPLPALFVLVGFMARAIDVTAVSGMDDGIFASGVLSTLLSWSLGFVLFGAAFLLRQRHFPAVLLWLGRISYSIYLVHGGLRLIWPYPVDDSMTGYPMLVVVAIPLSWATYSLIETPANRLQHRLFPHRVIPLRIAAAEEGIVDA